MCYGPRPLVVWRYSTSVTFIDCADGDTTYAAPCPPDDTTVIEITEVEYAQAQFFGGLSPHWPKAQLRTPDGVVLSTGRAPLRDWDTEMAAIAAHDAYYSAYVARIRAEDEDRAAGFAWRHDPATLPRLRAAEAALDAARAAEKAAIALHRSYTTAA